MSSFVKAMLQNRYSIIEQLLDVYPNGYHVTCSSEDIDSVLLNAATTNN